LTRRSNKSQYKKLAHLKGGIQRRNYYRDELKKLNEEIKKKQEEEVNDEKKIKS